MLGDGRETLAIHPLSKTINAAYYLTVEWDLNCCFCANESHFSLKILWQIGLNLKFMIGRRLLIIRTICINSTFPPSSYNDFFSLSQTSYWVYITLLELGVNRWKDIWVVSKFWWLWIFYKICLQVLSGYKFSFNLSTLSNSYV